MSGFSVSFPHVEPVAFLRGLWTEEPSELWQSVQYFLAPFPNYAEISELTEFFWKRGENPVRLKVVCPSAVWKVSSLFTRAGAPRRFIYEAYRASDPWLLKHTDLEHTIFSSEVRMLQAMGTMYSNSVPVGSERGVNHEIIDTT